MAKVCRSCQQPSDQPRHAHCSKCAYDRLPTWQKADAERAAGIPGLAEKPTEIPEGQRWCGRCRRVRPLTDFHLTPAKKPLPYCECCDNLRKFEAKLRREFGMTIADYDAMLAVQSGVCAICLHPPKGQFRLAVDHNHLTGERRGLLHSYCNMERLRAFHHDSAMLRRAADYLDDPPARRVARPLTVSRPNGA